MSWINNNKFASVVMLLTVSISSILLYLGVEERAHAKSYYAQKIAAERSLQSLNLNNPYPSSENRRLIREEVSGLAKDTYHFQKEFLKFLAPEVGAVTPAEFNKKVGEYVKLLKLKYTKHEIRLPKNTSFGFEVYEGALADKKVTATLEQEARALQWLFTTLAECKPTALNNVHRHLTKAEKNLKRAGGDKARSRGRRPQKVDSVYESMPLEIIFTGEEGCLREFLIKLTESEKYFFAVRALRLENEDANSPDLSRADFPEDSKELSSQPDFFEDVPESKKEKNSKGKVLKKVVGEEKIVVYLKLDLLLFKTEEEVPIPSFTKKKKAYGENKK